MTTTSARNTPLDAGHLRPGLRLFAVGDIHGHADLLGRVATMIADDLVQHPPAEALTVFVGDYIDRGPDSATVIERLRRGDFPTSLIALRGNHEQMLLDGLADARALNNWIFNGGAETAMSYGVGAAAVSDGNPERLRRALLDTIPADHLAFFEATEPCRWIDGYFFAHAGIQPGIPLDRQDPDVLMWIRQPFHASEADHGAIVVHGHTPVRRPDVRPNRINIDTGAFKTGHLTCLVLEGPDYRFLST